MRWDSFPIAAMLEIILGLRADFPEQVNYNNLTSLEQAEEIAGYDLLVPSVLPEGFVFSRAMYDPNLERVILYYQPQEGTRAVSGVNLLVIQNPRANQPVSWEGYPASAVEAVQVGSLPATFVRGMVLDGVYDPDAQVKLVWESGDRSVQLAYFAQPGYPTRLDKEEMIAIAESMQ